MRHGQDDHSLHSPQFDMKQHQFKYKPPRQQIQPEYGQSPSYVQYQHPNSHMNQGQMPAMSPASFHPSMGYNGNPPPATFTSRTTTALCRRRTGTFSCIPITRTQALTTLRSMPATTRTQTGSCIRIQARAR